MLWQCGRTRRKGRGSTSTLSEGQRASKHGHLGVAKLGRSTKACAGVSVPRRCPCPRVLLLYASCPFDHCVITDVGCGTIHVRP